MTVTQANHPDVTTLSETDVAQLAQRLEDDDYSSPFEALNDWHCLRAIAFQRPELVEQYLYLLDLEAFDES
jgi:type IV secretory pathway ATPase VirB11/archaellum biosynthesis ATPase